MRLLKLSLCCLPGLLVAPGVAGQANPSLQIDLDHATFAFGEGNSLVELYMAFDAQSLRFHPYQGSMLAQLPVVSAMRRSSVSTTDPAPTEAVWRDTTTISFVVSDTSNIVPGQFFVHQLRSTVPPGEYEMDLTIPGDSVSGRADMVLRRDVVVPDFDSDDRIGMSDITLASSIVTSQDRESTFYKNGLEIRPNANQLYGGGLPQVFYYAEAYNLSPATADGDTYSLMAYIASRNLPQPITGLSKRSSRKVRSPDVLVGAFDISGLASGSYFLRVALLNGSNEAMAEQSRKFFVYNPNVERTQPVAVTVSYESSEYASMSAEEVAAELEKIEVISTDRERRRGRSIQDVDEQRQYLMDFWSKRDPRPDTNDNEFRDEFYSRIQFANERYTTRFTEGWDSDRGQAILKYGMPSNVEPHLYDRGYNPYEVWQYNNIPGQGVAMFVFADLDGFGAFELLHSTVSGERKSPSWQEEVVQR